PTAAGKTFLMLNWLLKEFENDIVRLAVVLAPTRALVGEIEKQLLELRKGFDIPELQIASLPLNQFGTRERPTILVFTQERLHLFFNTAKVPPTIDIAVVDEAQKLNDGSRGVILQDALERIVRTSSECQFVFLTPHASNPGTLLEDAPPDMPTGIVPGLT